MVRKRIVGLAMVVLVATIGIAAVSTHAVFAYEQKELSPPIFCEAPQPFDFGKVLGD